jgi:hypothetical protein
MPTKMMAPIAQSVTLTGIPSLLAISTVNAEPSSIATPLKWWVIIKTAPMFVIISYGLYVFDYF